MPAATILHLSDYGGPYRGSFVPMLGAIAAAARAHGWEAECGFTPVAGGRPWLADLQRESIAVQIAPADGRRRLTGWLGRRLAQLPGPVVVHTHFTSFDLPAVRAAARRPDIAVVWHVHSFLSRDPVSVVRARAKYGWLARQTARVLCVSDATAADIVRRGADERRVLVVPNGVDTAAFPVIPTTDRRRARADLGLERTDRVLLHFAWDWELKGGPRFIATLEALKARGVRAIGLTVGGGKRARAAVSRAGLNDLVRVIEPRDDVRTLYAAADAFVACSGGEGAPFALLEALSSGTAVIATDIPGHALAGGGPAALRIGPLAPDGLAAVAAEALQRSEGEAEAEASGAAGWVARNLDLGPWAERICAIYAEVVGDLRTVPSTP